MKLLGVMLVVLGTLALLYGGLTYVTQEKVVDVGPIEVLAERERMIWIPPILGAVTVVLGLIMVLSGRKELA